MPKATKQAETKTAKPARAKRAVRKPIPETTTGQAMQAAIAEKQASGQAVPAFVSSYAGPSKALNTARGKRERLDRSYIPGSFTYRDDAFLRDLIAQYGAKTFSTNALDKKQCERLHGAGVLAFASTDNDDMRVTERGQRYASKTSPASNGSKPVALSAIN